MSKKNETATTDQKITFLLAILNSEEKRRRGFENKDSLLIAANALLSSAIVLHGIPLLKNQSSYTWLHRDFIGAALAFFVFSVVMTFVSIVNISQKVRSSLLDSVSPDRKSENNLFFYEIIAESGKEAYKNKIVALTPDEIIDQLSSQIHNLARILKRRGQIMNVAIVMFIGAIISMGALLIVEIFLG